MDETVTQEPGGRAGGLDARATYEVPGPASRLLLERQARRESNARTYPRHLPLVISEAQGVFIKDADGQSYFDCLAGAGTLALGHNHPAVLEAMRRHLDGRKPLHTLDLMTPAKDEFVETLFASLPPRFAERARIQFCGPSGADAVEAAIKLVKTATGRRSLLTFHGAYHGMTHGALSLTGSLGPKEALAGLMPDVHFLPYPYPYRSAFGGAPAEEARACGRYIRSVLENPQSGIPAPAGMILEVVQGEGGTLPAPDAWVQEMRRLTRELNVPLIVDEIQTGLGRTGSLYAFQHAGITPDVILLSKAVGGGLPLSVVVYDAALDCWRPGAHTGTFRGNQLAMAAGAATLRYIVEHKLDEHAVEMGGRMMSHLGGLQKEFPCFGEVRGRGLMVAVEIVEPEAAADELGSRPAAPELARRIMTESLRRGLILEIGGWRDSVIRFLTPLIVTGQQVDSICEIFARAVKAAAAQAPPPAGK